MLSYITFTSLKRLQIPSTTATEGTCLFYVKYTAVSVEFESFLDN